MIEAIIIVTIDTVHITITFDYFGLRHRRRRGGLDGLQGGGGGGRRFHSTGLDIDSGPKNYTKAKKNSRNLLQKLK